jgi:hypothetical protein
MDHIPYTKLVKIVKKVAIRGHDQVLKTPNRNKSPWGKTWDHYPRDYTKKINDPKYPTGIVCDYIKDLDLHLGIIDLDVPKNENDIPINSLKSKAGKIIENTYSVQTPSGGYQIYLLSRKKPEAKQPSKLNVDYQVNKSNTKENIA